MKICFLSAASSYHTHKWCRFFSERGHEVHVISLTGGECAYATVHLIESGMKGRFDSSFTKLNYLFHGKAVKRILKEIKPDIIHAHRIPSYGGLCALNGISPYILSVWGGDVYSFPKKSPLHRFLVNRALNKASCIMSTSNAMKLETQKYTNHPILVTPFGVNTAFFTPEKRNRGDDGLFVVGNIKSLEKKYGIEYLLEAAAIVREQRPDIHIRLRIAGSGSYEGELKSRARELGIDEITDWLGFIDSEQVAQEWANMDVAVVSSVSDSESFGVSAVEAQACEVPVIVSNIPGLLEATMKDVTSLVVERRDAAGIAKGIIYLYDHPEIRKQFGENGRSFVKKNYEIEKCFSEVEDFYHRFSEKHRIMD